MKDRLIDNMIDEIVLNFDNDDITDLVLKKLSSMRGKHILKQEENEVSLKDKNFARTVKTDSDNHTIELIEKGMKIENNEQKAFTNSINYNVNNGSGLVIKSMKDNKKIFGRNYDVVSSEKKSVYTYYIEGKKVSVNVEIVNHKATIDKDDNKISEDKETIKIINYYLIYGDYIQRKEVNGEVKFYYFNKTNDGEILRIEISEDDFNRLLLYKDDYYEILNDKLFQKIRK